MVDLSTLNGVFWVGFACKIDIKIWRFCSLLIKLRNVIASLLMMSNFIIATSAFAENHAINNLVKSSKLIFQCSLPPEFFSIYQINNETDIAGLIVKEGEVEKLVTLTNWRTEGTGPCRHDIWSFDYKGKMSVQTIGCYGEIIPPENAEGEIWFHYPEEYNRSYFCY